MDLAPFIVVVLGFVGAFLACRGLDPRERKFALGAYIVHVFASVAHWAIEVVYYPSSDSHGYIERGTDLARLLDANFIRFAPEIAKYALHADNSLPFEGATDGNATGTLVAIAGIFIYLVGPSLLSMNLLTTCISWVGQLYLYRVAREELTIRDRTPALLGFLYVPSVVFWASGFAKESIVLGFLGLLAYSTYRLGYRRNAVYLPGIVIGAVGVAMIKPYILFPYVFGVAAFFYADRAWRSGRIARVRPVYLVLAGALSIGGIAGMGSLFPQFGAGKVAETMAVQQGEWQLTEGGSNIDVGDERARTLPQQLVFAPLALINALFRPAIFEARNGPSFMAAVETTLLALAVLSLLGRGRLAIVRDMLLRTPLLIFFIVFVLVFGVAVGLATSNLGSLSRYRLPMMPFYVTTLLVLRRRIRDVEWANRPSALTAIHRRDSRAA